MQHESIFNFSGLLPDLGRTFLASLVVAIFHGEYDRIRVAVVHCDRHVGFHANHLAIHRATTTRFRALEHGKVINGRNLRRTLLVRFATKPSKILNFFGDRGNRTRCISRGYFTSLTRFSKKNQPLHFLSTIPFVQGEIEEERLDEAL